MSRGSGPMACQRLTRPAQRSRRCWPAIVRSSTCDFLRLVIDDLDWNAAILEGRVTIEGDENQVRTLFAATYRR